MLEQPFDIFFYFPQDGLSESNLPQRLDEYWPWLCNQKSISEMNGGGCIWTLQTYLHLKAHGFPCKLTQSIPDKGIVISHRDYINKKIKPTKDLFWVCLRADATQHPYANLHVVQNPFQVNNKRYLSVWKNVYIPHWPQPSLIPRDPQRGDTFENVAFFGNRSNLASEFQTNDWYQALEKLGLNFQVKATHREWNDYSETDVILAVRRFGYQECRNKPASKLYNSWHAHVPAILGSESAFRFEKKSDLDYLEATSLEEVLFCLQKLKQNPRLRQKMRENAHLRSQEVSIEHILSQWERFFTEIVLPTYIEWQTFPEWKRQSFLMVRYQFTAMRQNYYQIREMLSNARSII